MPNLIAKKSFSYATRMLRAGDAFSAGRRDAKILVAIGKAKLDDTPKSDLVALRDEYQSITGSKADGRWGAVALQERIDAAKSVVQPQSVDQPVTDTSDGGAE